MFVVLIYDRKIEKVVGYIIANDNDIMDKLIYDIDEKRCYDIYSLNSLTYHDIYFYPGEDTRIRIKTHIYDFISLELQTRFLTTIKRYDE